ncbi:class I SAM-dependent methyltransferase [Nocardia sp. NPDC050710]|uniref:class I SAM-dependent methyltransferase n=1 Tax=Nocardia sp. NPDC050710 TaxID=3157220 RepID=UPI0033C0FEF4
MQNGRPSATARAIGHIRALHLRADNGSIFNDPLAERILGEPVLPETELDRGLDPDVVRRRRLYIAARSRFADDCMAAAIARGTEQVVILGAGLDTAAYRNTHTNVRVFEVDHPDTQDWKRHLLSESGIAIPDSLEFVAIDFDQSTLADGLATAGLNRNRSALYIWLGVTMYLTGPAVDDTLRYIAGHPASEVVFDYFYPVVSTPREHTEQLHARAESTARLGEPWITFFRAAEIRASLLSFGYKQVEDRSAAELVASYGIRATSRPTDTDSGPHLIHACTA